MGLILAPGLRTIPNRIKGGQARNVINFAYDWSTVTPAQQNLGGYGFTGAVWELDVQSVRSPSTANLEAFKSLQFTETFANAPESGHADGALIIYLPDTGQLMIFGNDISDTLTELYSILTAVVPIIGTAPTKIQFGKDSDGGGGMNGTLRGTLVDFQLDTYNYIGYSASA